MSHIVLTGVSRGLGLAMTEGFIERDHTVSGCARSPEKIAILRKRFGQPHDFAPVDVADDGQVAAWAAGVLDRAGPPDFLVNNAAVITENARLWEVEPQDFSWLIDVNIKGVYHVLRHFIPAMVQRGSGVIVNFSSGWGRSTSPEVAPYCASKWAIEGLTQALAAELPAGVAAIALNPGIINTDMLALSFGDDAASFPSPQQWARRAVPFLLQLSRADNGRPLSVPGE